MFEYELILVLLFINMFLVFLLIREKILFAIFPNRAVRYFIKTKTNKAKTGIALLKPDNTFKALGKVFVWDRNNAVGRYGFFDEDSSSMLKLEKGKYDINSLEFTNVYNNKALEWLMLVRKSLHLNLILICVFAILFITILNMCRIYGFIK